MIAAHEKPRRMFRQAQKFEWCTGTRTWYRVKVLDASDLMKVRVRIYNTDNEFVSSPVWFDTQMPQRALAAFLKDMQAERVDDNEFINDPSPDPRGMDW